MNGKEEWVYMCVSHGCRKMYRTQYGLRKHAEDAHFITSMPEVAPVRMSSNFRRGPRQTVMAKGRKKKKEPDGECGICYEGICESENPSGVCVPCGHAGFHLSCVQTWLKKDPTCPCCRVRVDRAMKIFL